jgi:hypothetical protein
VPIRLNKKVRDVGDTARDPSLHDDFVAAVMNPAHQALLIDVDNRGAGWISTGEMAGRCAAGVVQPLVLAVDLDCPLRAAPLSEQIAAAAAARGLVAVIEESGGAGARHVWVRCRTLAEWDQLDAAVRNLAVAAGVPHPVRSGEGGRMRPPLAPHRTGAVLRLISPTDPAAALAALQAPADVPAPAVPRRRHTAVALPEPALGATVTLGRMRAQMRAVLRYGADAAPGRYIGERGEVDQSIVARAVAVAVMRAGGTIADLKQLFADPHNAAGESYRKRLDGGSRVAHEKERRVARQRAGSARTALRWLSSVWPDAAELDADDVAAGYKHKRTASRVDPTADDAVVRMVAAHRAAAAAWRHERSPYDQLGVDYYCWKALAKNTLTPPVSVREWAEHTGLSTSGVRTSQARLTGSLGLLQVARRGRGTVTGIDGHLTHEGTVWRLLTPQPSDQHTGGTPPSGGAPCVSTSPISPLVPGSDASTAAGPRAHQILRLLAQHGSLTAEQLLQKTGLRDRDALLRCASAGRPRGGPLRVLLDSGLVNRDGDLYRCAPATDGLEEALVAHVATRRPSVDGRCERVRERHAAERAVYLEWRSEAAPQRLIRQVACIEASYTLRWAGTPRAAGGKIIARRWAHRHGLDAPHPIDQRRRAERRRWQEQRAEKRDRRRMHQVHRGGCTTMDDVSKHGRGGPARPVASMAQNVQLTLASIGLGHLAPTFPPEPDASMEHSTPTPLEFRRAPS